MVPGSHWSMKYSWENFIYNIVILHHQIKATSYILQMFSRVREVIVDIKIHFYKDKILDDVSV